MNINKQKAKKLIKRADALLNLAKWEEAEQNLLKAIKFDNKNPEAYYLLGEALCKQEKFPEAIDSLLTADKLEPNNPRIFHLLGWTNFMNGSVEVGREMMISAHQMYPDDIQILCDPAVLENKETNYQKAKEYILKALEIDPAHPTANEVLQVIEFFEKFKIDLSNKVN